MSPLCSFPKALVFCWCCDVVFSGILSFFLSFLHFFHSMWFQFRQDVLQNYNSCRVKYFRSWKRALLQSVPPFTQGFLQRDSGIIESHRSQQKTPLQSGRAKSNTTLEKKVWMCLTVRRHKRYIYDQRGLLENNTRVVITHFTFLIRVL